jgi:hypothetical protein
VSLDKSDEAGQLGQDRQTGQAGPGNRDGTTVAGQSGYGSWERTTETGQPGHEPWQNREDKSEDDSNTRTAASGEPWTRLLGQDSWHRTAGIGQLGRDSQDRTAGTGQPEKAIRTVYPEL